MNKEYRLEKLDKPDDATWQVVGGGLHQFNVQQVGDSQSHNICFVIYNREQEVVGGLVGETHWGWFYINLMFIKEELRGRGYGQKLLQMAEEEARTLGATRAYLDTFSFQALDFYKKYGYEVFGALEAFPPGHQRYYMSKQLTS